jgi:ankyrin repeat protein
MMPKDNSISDEYLCPISGQIMVDPVTTADGNTYEREKIEEWLKTKDTSPLTNEILRHKELTSNLYARRHISNFLNSHPELYDANEVYLPKSWMAEFVKAIKDNQPQEAQRWLDKDRRLLTLKLEDDSTALHLACQFSSPELVDILLKVLKQKNQAIQPGAVGFKPVHLNVLLERSLTSGDSAKCELLLKLGAEVEQPEQSTQNTLLHRMVITGNQQAVSWLLEKKALLEIRNSEGNTPLLLSVIHNNIKLAEFLLTMKANPQVIQPEATGFTSVDLNVLLERALTNGDYAKCELLLKLGAAVEQPEASTQNTLLHRMVIKNNPQAVSWLLEKKVLLESRNSEGNTPLLLSVMHNNIKLAEFLLKMQANAQVKNAEQQSPVLIALLNQNKSMLCLLVGAEKASMIPLHLALELNDNAIIKALLKEKIGDIEARDTQQRTPFYNAIERGNAEAATLLLRQGADPTVSCGLLQLNALHIAAERDGVGMVRYLLRTKALVVIDAQNAKGDTPLHLAVQAGHDSIISLLLEAGAYHKIKNEKGQTPMDLAREQQKPETINLILQAARGFKKSKLKEIDRLNQVVVDQASEIVLLKNNFKAQVSDMQAKIKLLQLLKGGVDLNFNKQGRSGRTPVHKAAQYGHAAAITALHLAGATVNTSNTNGETPIFTAAQNGHALAITALIAAGANADTPDKDDKTPIWVAAEHGYLEAIIVLIAEHANVHTPNKNGETPLFIAAQNGHAAAITELLAAGADADTHSKDGKTPIWVAAGNGHLEAIIVLIDAQANVNTTNANGETPVFIAAQNGHAATITELLAAGADADTPHAGGTTPIFLATHRGHIDVINVLIAAGASLDTFSSTRTTLFHMAAQGGHASAITILKAAGAPLDTTARHGATPVYLAASQGHASAITALKAAGADVNTVDSNYNQTPVFIAAQNGHAAAITALKAAGANVDTVNISQQAPIYIAAQNGHAAAITALVTAGAKADTAGSYGQTPIFTAAQNGHVAAIAALVIAGADVNAADPNKQTPILIAAQNGHAAAIATLVTAGADVNSVNPDRQTPIWIASQNGHVAAITALKALGAHVNTPDANGKTPVFIAAQNENAAAITALQAAGADVNMLDSNGKTPLWVAAIGAPEAYHGYATQRGNVGAVISLLEAAADASIKLNCAPANGRTVFSGVKYTVLEYMRATKEPTAKIPEIQLLLEEHFRQYPTGIKPVKVRDKQIVKHANPFSSTEQKNPPMLTRFSQPTRVRNKQVVMHANPSSSTEQKNRSTLNSV